MSKNISAATETAAASSEIEARTLVEIYLDDDVTLRLVANETVDIEYNEQTYIAAQIERGEISTSVDAKTEKMSLKLSNIWREWAAYAAANRKKLQGRRCKVMEVFLDIPHIEENIVWQFEGRMAEPHFTVSEFAVSVQRHLSDFTAESPNMTYDPNCQYRRFKDERCQYAGSETTCDKTMTRCKALGNVERFGGHPSVPYEMVIKY